MNGSSTQLGRLESVGLRSVWATEAGDFTPWLAQEANIAILAESIGIELEVQATEKEVGPFRADILCKEAEADHWVLIENQLERTDHGHLGQLLTYASGLEAVTIIWIAETFTDEHRAVLDWLNEITDETVHFFGLEIELWRIGDSPPAPKFNIVSKPNDWVKTVKENAAARTLSDTRTLQLEFWRAFANVVQSETDLKISRPKPSAYATVRLGRADTHLAAVAANWDHDEGAFTWVLRVELVLGARDRQLFEELRSDSDVIGREIGESLIWDNRPEVKRCKVYVRRPADVEAVALWNEHHRWLKDMLVRFHNVFKPRIADFDRRDVKSC